MSPVHHESAFGDAIVAAMLERGWQEGRPAGLPGRPRPGHRRAVHLHRCDPGRRVERAARPLRQRPRRGAARVRQAARSGDRHRRAARRAAQRASRTAACASGSPTSSRTSSADDSVLDDYRANRLTVVRELAVRDQAGRLGQPARPRAVPQRHPGRHRRAEEPADRPGRRARQGAVPHRPGPDRADLHAPRRRELRRRPGPGLRRHPAARRQDPVPAVQHRVGTAPASPAAPGNPAPTAPGTYATSYLWEQIWQPDNWLDLLQRFVHLQKDKTPGGGTTQVDDLPALPPVGRRQEAHRARRPPRRRAQLPRHGLGRLGQVEHHRLARAPPQRPAHAHRPRRAGPRGRRERASSPASRSSTRSSSSPTAVTSTPSSGRRSAASSRPPGLVVKIDEKHGAKSEQLAKALSRETGQDRHRHPAHVPGAARLPAAQPHRDPGQHASRSSWTRRTRPSPATRRPPCKAGSARPRPGRRLRRPGRDPSASTTEQKLTHKAAQRGRAANLSYFAFTATPKAKTLENCSAPPETVDGEATYRPFHTYSMRQAIEEGFILDPLRNYVTYNTYWKLVNENPDEREVDPSKANSAARPVRAHPRLDRRPARPGHRRALPSRTPAAGSAAGRSRWW